MGEELNKYLKILKRFSGVFYSPGLTSYQVSWAWDFDNNFKVANVTRDGGLNESLWGESEWGSDDAGIPDTLTTDEERETITIEDGTAVATGYSRDDSAKGDPQGFWTGGTVLQRYSLNAGGTGQYLKFGTQAEIAGAKVSTQTIEVLTKIGRMV